MKTERLLPIIEAKIDALTQLLLSHIIAADLVTPGTGAKTLEYAAHQEQAAEDQNKAGTAMFLGDMLDDLRKVLDLAANDL